MIISVPFVLALVAIDNLSRASSVQMSPGSGRLMVCHGSVSYTLNDGEGCQSETQRQAGISQSSERQSE